MSYYKLGLLLLSLFFSFSSNAQDKIIRVALASSLMPAMEEIKRAFESENDVQLDLIPGASGTLTNQILHGAPYDIFISANEKYGQLLDEQGFLAGAPIILVNGALVIWSSRQMTSISNSNHAMLAEYLDSPKVKTIAIAQPGLAPYGDAAKTYLIKIGVFDQIQSKLIYGNNLTITNQYIYTKSADVVLTSLSSQIKMKSIAPKYWYSPEFETHLAHSICLLKNSRVELLKLQCFMFQPKSISIFEKYGYSLIIQ